MSTRIPIRFSRRSAGSEQHPRKRQLIADCRDASLAALWGRTNELLKNVTSRKLAMDSAISRSRRLFGRRHRRSSVGNDASSNRGLSDWSRNTRAANRDPSRAGQSKSEGSAEARRRKHTLVGTQAGYRNGCQQIQFAAHPRTGPIATSSAGTLHGQQRPAVRGVSRRHRRSLHGLSAACRHLLCG